MAKVNNLQTLIDLNAELYKQPPRKAAVLSLPAHIESLYARKLTALLGTLAQSVIENVVPVLKQEKPNYVKDSDGVFAYSIDGYAERIIAALARALSDFEGGVFEDHIERLARDAVTATEAATTGNLVKTFNRSVGVDLTQALQNERLDDHIDAAIKHNVSLIKTIPRKYFDRVEQTILTGMRSGMHPTTIFKQLAKQYKISKSDASRIAIDQTLKLNSEITQIRQSAAGISYYRSVTAKDTHVTGNPAGIYPNSKIKCYYIARKDIGYGPGVYTWAKGASYAGEKKLYPGRHHPLCRCIASPVFDFELPKNKRRG